MPKKIFFTNKPPTFFALVDDEDYERISAFKWYWWKGTCKTPYARAIPIRGNRKTILMHNCVIGKSLNRKLMVDHIDFNGLNNTKANLRFVTAQQNKAHSKDDRNSGKFRGVSKSGKYFIARIRVMGKNKKIGKFRRKCEAAIAYNRAALKYFGGIAVLNPEKPGVKPVRVYRKYRKRTPLVPVA